MLYSSFKTLTRIYFISEFTPQKMPSSRSGKVDLDKKPHRDQSKSRLSRNSEKKSEKDGELKPMSRGTSSHRRHRKSTHSHKSHRKKKRDNSSPPPPLPAALKPLVEYDDVSTDESLSLSERESPVIPSPPPAPRRLPTPPTSKDKKSKKRSKSSKIRDSSPCMSSQVKSVSRRNRDRKDKLPAAESDSRSRDRSIYPSRMRDAPSLQPSAYGPPEDNYDRLGYYRDPYDNYHGMHSMPEGYLNARDRIRPAQPWPVRESDSRAPTVQRKRAASPSEDYSKSRRSPSPEAPRAYRANRSPSTHTSPRFGKSRKISPADTRERDRPRDVSTSPSPAANRWSSKSRSKSPKHR